MRVLQLLLSDRIGGAETLAESLHANFQNFGWDATIAYLDPAQRKGSPRKRLASVRAQVDAAKPDVILSHSALPNLYARLAWLGPVVTVLHSATDDFENAQLRVAERLLQRRTAATVAVSSEAAVVYRRRFGRTPLVIPNGVRAHFLPSDRDVAGPPRIVCCARLSAQKDPATWFQIAARVMAAVDAEFTWYGPDEGGMLNSERPDDERWHHSFKGPTAAPWDVVRSASIYLHAATREAHPIALLEAAAAGVPIVCTRDVAKKLPVGLVTATFRSGDVDDGANAILRCIATLPALRGPAIIASERVRSEFSMQKCAAAYAACLNTAVTVRGER
jgi:glycosyltransferase involved in cell wall biosynthesis